MTPVRSSQPFSEENDSTIMYVISTRVLSGYSRFSHNFQIGEISLMKEMTSVTEVMMSEEDKEELKAAAGAGGVKGSKDGKPVAGSPNETTIPGIPHPEQTTEKTSMSPMTQDGPSDHAPQPSSSTPSTTTQGTKDKEKEKAKSSTTTPRPSTDNKPTPSSSHLSPLDTPGSGTSTPKEIGTKERLEKEHSGTPKRKMKLTPEQKAKIDEIGEERDKAMDARIEELTRKLKDVSVGVIYTLPPFLFLFLFLFGAGNDD
jgi:hypothetical protein